MKTTIIILAVAVVLGIGAFLFFSGSGYAPYASTPTAETPAAPVTSAPTPAVVSPAPVPAPAPAPAPSAVTVDIKNFAFSPGTLTVKTGTKVTWINNDTAPHTVTSDSGTFLNSATLSSGQSFSFAFTSAGSVDYHCRIHPMMKGAVVVEQ